MNVVKTVVKSDDEVNLDPIKNKYKDFTDGLAKDLEAAGKKAGDKLTGGIAAGMEKASTKVVKATKEQEDALKKLRIAQQQLIEVQENSRAKESQRMAAADAYTRALERVNDATHKVASAERELNDERSKLANMGSTTQTINFDVKSSLGNIRNQAISELKSAGIAGGAAFAGGLAAGLSPQAAAGLFVGIAAAAQSNNDQVRAKFSDLWEQVKQGAQEASAGTADEFVGLAERLGRTFNTLKPQLTAGMEAAAPLVTAFGDGLDRLAKTAMPGVVAATKAMGQSSSSVTDLMESAGRSVNNFFMESKEGAAAGGQAMEAFGRIVERLSSFVGRAVADLANMSGGVVPQLEGAVNSAADAAENFIETIGPSLASGAAMGLSGLSALLQLVNGIISILGPAAPIVSSFATGLKALDMITFGGVKGQWDGFVDSIRNAEGPAAKTKAGLSGVLTTLGPVGIAAGVLTLGLSSLADEQADAAQKAQQHRDAIKTLATEFERTGGAVDGAMRKMVGERIVNDFGDAKKAADSLGIGLDELAGAALKQGDQYDVLHAKIERLIEAEKEYQQTQGSTDPNAGTNEYMENLMKVKAMLEALGEETNQGKRRQQELADAMGDASRKTNTLAEEFDTLANKTATAESKADALYQIMRRMAGGAPDVEEATKKWEEFIDTFNTKEMNFDDKAAGTKAWAAALLDAQGKINLTTEDGRKLYTTVTDMSRAFQETATSMKANGDSADAIKGRLQAMRDQFIGVAQQMGFNRAQAEALANQYGLVPKDVNTLVTSNLAPEIQKAIDLGYHITNLPDGSVMVQANTANAQGNIDAFIQRNDGRVIHTFTWNYLMNAPAGSMPLSQGRKAAGGPIASVSASSGGARSGVVMTNEGGRQESIVLPDRSEMAIPITAPVGSQVRPHAGNDFLRGGGGMVMPIVGEITIHDDGSDAAKAIGYLVRKFVKFRGGDPIKALGQ